jgi:hypothetical protein
MKSAVQTCVRTTEFGIKQDKLMKPKHEENTEMQQCFSKLKELVPSVPKDIKLSKTQLLQHVIDYILDLESTLDVPSVINPVSCRSPLSEKCQPNVIGDVSIYFVVFLLQFIAEIYFFLQKYNILYCVRSKPSRNCVNNNNIAI